MFKLECQIIIDMLAALVHLILVIKWSYQRIQPLDESCFYLSTLQPQGPWLQLSDHM